MIICAAVVAAFDFHSDEAAECAKKHWGEIKAIVDPKISMMSTILPRASVAKVQELLGGSDSLPDSPPSRDWLSKAADALPDRLMSMFGKDIIEKCVNEMKKH
ncbi:hypothetical protein J3B02_004740 [Coemansia erecta]|nr:hypothetical protein J3B02_004740 [Coemansia erecta]KAJ2862904.1 hypothetical protein FB639_005336 [Coemansia asiatica]